MARRDRPSIMVRVTGHGLAPLGPYDAEVLAGFRIGAELSAELKQARHSGLNSKYWAILGRVVDNSDWPSARALNKALLMEAKHVSHTRLMDGSLLVEPRDLSDLDGPEFEQFYSTALDFICEHVLPGMDRADLERDPRDRRAA